VNSLFFAISSLPFSLPQFVSHLVHVQSNLRAMSQRLCHFSRFFVHVMRFGSRHNRRLTSFVLLALLPLKLDVPFATFGTKELLWLLLAGIPSKEDELGGTTAAFTTELMVTGLGLGFVPPLPCEVLKPIHFERFGLHVFQKLIGDMREINRKFFGESPIILIELLNLCFLFGDCFPRTLDGLLEMHSFPILGVANFDQLAVELVESLLSFPQRARSCSFSLRNFSFSLTVFAVNR